MKITKLFAFLFAVLGLCGAVAGIYLGFSNLDADPILVQQPESAREQVEDLMEAVCAGDYAAASALLYGNPDLGMERDAADRVGMLLWEAMESSRTYTLSDEFYATNTGVALDVQMSCLDMASVTVNLRERSQKLLEQRMQEAEDPSEVYDENNEYREDFVMEVLYDAAVEALAEDAKTTTQDVTLNLIYDRGQWKIMPEAALLSAISGGIAG